MKKLFISAIMAVFALGASAQSYEISLSKGDGQTKITIKSEELGRSQNLNFVLIADGKSYTPRHVNTNIDDGVGTVDINFGQLPDFKKGALTFDCNSETVTVNITNEGKENQNSTTLSFEKK